MRTFCVVDEPEDFARALIELYESEELWNRLSENGCQKQHAPFTRLTPPARNWSFYFAMSISTDCDDPPR